MDGQAMEAMAEECSWVWLRIYLNGQKPRSGACVKCLCSLDAPPLRGFVPSLSSSSSSSPSSSSVPATSSSAPPSSSSSSSSAPPSSASPSTSSCATSAALPAILCYGRVRVRGPDALAAVERVQPSAREFTARYWSEYVEGFLPIEAHEDLFAPVPSTTARTPQHAAVPRIDVCLFSDTLQTAQSSVSMSEDKTKGQGNWFSIGIHRGKTEANHGTLWRSAYQLGASSIFTIGARYNKSVEGASDTVTAWASIPYHAYQKWEHFALAAPSGAVWVAIEMGGTPLQEFVHPPRAVYILGSEDHGLPKEIARACHQHISIPSVRSSSYNVAVAASIIMYDRLVKGAQWQGRVGREARKLAAASSAGVQERSNRSACTSPSTGVTDSTSELASSGSEQADAPG
eukprot:TRINITY_DN194_c0_g2_i1.p1 TRINITY_DN194_c0_g2~~TRINITY_DN194_c0_g2_i1.p1  ORF type:complete len:401 (+),score=98.90 TRINITY_DN194_c0_g2_i1:174-1376(+)